MIIQDQIEIMAMMKILVLLSLANVLLVIRVGQLVFFAIKGRQRLLNDFGTLRHIIILLTVLLCVVGASTGLHVAFGLL